MTQTSHPALPRTEQSEPTVATAAAEYRSPVLAQLSDANQPHEATPPQRPTFRSGAVAFGLEPRYLRERRRHPRFEAPAAADTVQASVAADPFGPNMNYPSFDEMTSQLRRRVLDTQVDDGPRLVPSVALPVIVTLSALLWMAMTDGMDLHSITSVAANLLG